MSPVEEAESRLRLWLAGTVGYQYDSHAADLTLLVEDWRRVRNLALKLAERIADASEVLGRVAERVRADGREQLAEFDRRRAEAEQRIKAGCRQTDGRIV